MQLSARVDPFGSTHFGVEIDGLPASGFLEVSGISVEVGVVDYRTGSDTKVRKLPGEVTFNNIVFKRGLTADLSLWNWMNQTLQGDVVRRNMAVVILSEMDSVLLRFNVSNAWPVNWAVSALQAEGCEVLVETLEVTHEGLSVVA